MAKWTEAQQRVIDIRKKNLLVSAAAGSGKTAVLVERIISMISEGEQPIDIDHLLVVTFTNAAAAQMRERIGKALDKKLLDQPGNEHLQKQLSLLQSAQITTIHSFCLNVIRNYFHRIELDPSFKLAEESEITLLQSDVMSEVLERWYDEGSEDFLEFIESYSYSKSDQPIEDLVLQLYRFSMSNPWPGEWICHIRESFEPGSLEELEKADWMQELLSYVKVVLSDLMKKNEAAIAICEEADGPSAYLPALFSDRELMRFLCKADTYGEYARLFAEISYERLSAKREEGVSATKKDRVKALREEVKKGIKDLSGQFFFQPPEEMLRDMIAVSKVMKVLFRLTLDFMEEFAKKKEEKNLIDFNDLEHYALNILVEDQDGQKVPTRAAEELSELFEEILIDEYQDSNLVQETILKSISREAMGGYNRFMVGDVKQSIYKFRLAMPELFMEKYRTYTTEDVIAGGETNCNLRIDLDKNFRSRRVVLDYVNRIFEQIMTEPIGGILYDDAASLKYGELFEELLPVQSGDAASVTEDEGENADTVGTEEARAEEVLSPSLQIAEDVELLLITDEEIVDEVRANEKEENGGALQELRTSDGSNGMNGYETSANEAEEDAEEAVYSRKELEARTLAVRIRELTDPEKGLRLFDQSNLSYRPAAYKDIVILLRSMSGWSEVFVNTLMQEGIPAYADTGSGYFQTVEIMTVLNMLRIIDNPRQDIPFVGVLYSPMVGLTTTELAQIRVHGRNKDMYQAALNYAEEGSTELRDKLEGFLKLLQDLREMVKFTPIHELILEVLERTGYRYYVLAMPGGDRRKANIDMLVNQAVRFEKGSYRGLFHFIRYMEKLNKYEIDFGEATTMGEQDNTVRIMSIHKSKGLEFPIVFVAGLSKQFNTQDIRNSIVIHSEYGVGPEYVDSVRRTKVPTLLKKVIQKKILMENLGEELRVLYVAMTRAKEKLILSGYLKSREEIRKKHFSFYELMSTKSYMELVLPAMMNRMSGVEIPKGYPCSIENKDQVIRLLHKADLMEQEITKQVILRMEQEELKSLGLDKIYDPQVREEIKTRFNYIYPYQKASGLKVKLSVSELKKLGQFVDEEQSELLYPESRAHDISSISELLPKVVGKELPEERTNEADTEISKEAVKDRSREADKDRSNEVDSDIGKEVDKNRSKEVFKEVVATVPEFIRGGGKETSGTDRGTLYHKVLELLDLPVVKTKEDVAAELARIVLENRLSEEDSRKLNQDYIFRFTQSPIAGRMREAQAKGKLFKEQQFVMGIQANEIYPDKNSEEPVLIQGIIDAFFEEEGELVLLDYKSDIVENEEQLVKRYKVQLEYYKRALEQILKKTVKEMVIYSLYLGKEIRCGEVSGTE